MTILIPIYVNRRQQFPEQARLYGRPLAAVVIIGQKGPMMRAIQAAAPLPKTRSGGLE